MVNNNNNKSKKRKRAESDPLAEKELEKEFSKRLKETEYDLNKLFDSIDTNATQDIIDYFTQIFPAHNYPQLPTMIYLNQLYSLIKSKTGVDRDIEELRNENKIVLFKCDSTNIDQSDICLCDTNEYNKYVKGLISNESSAAISKNLTKQQFEFLIDSFLNRVIKETKATSVSSQTLKSEFKYNDSDLTCLVQFGLLTIKDSSNFWLSIPNIGKFRQSLVEARKCLINTMRKKKYNEINCEELIKRNLKKINNVGISYLICDLVGNQTLRRVNSPICLKFKLED